MPIEFMAFFGAFLAALRGSYDLATLKTRISEFEQKLSEPILSSAQNFDVKNRYVFERTIREASLLKKLEEAHSKTECLSIKLKHLSEMKMVLNQNEQALKNQYASRNEVAFLGLAVQEIALCLEEHSREFKSTADKKLQEINLTLTEAKESLRIGKQTLEECRFQLDRLKMEAGQGEQTEMKLKRLEGKFLKIWCGIIFVGIFSVFAFAYFLFNAHRL